MLLSETKEGSRSFFSYPELLRLTLLSSTVQFAVGATLVLSIPFIRGILDFEAWEYGIFKGAFPIGYVLGMLLLTKLPKSSRLMYMGLLGIGFASLPFLSLNIRFVYIGIGAIIILPGLYYLLATYQPKKILVSEK